MLASQPKSGARLCYSPSHSSLSAKYQCYSLPKIICLSLNVKASLCLQRKERLGKHLLLLRYYMLNLLLLLILSLKKTSTQTSLSWGFAYNLS